MKIAIFILASLLFVSLLMIIAMYNGGTELRREAIRNSCAHYDTLTGTFTWGKP